MAQELTVAARELKELVQSSNELLASPSLGAVDQRVDNLFFRVKVILLVVAGLNVFLFHSRIHRTIDEWADQLRPPRARPLTRCLVAGFPWLPRHIRQKTAFPSRSANTFASEVVASGSAAIL